MTAHGPVVPEGTQVPARRVPLPNSVSAQARAYLAGMLRPDGTPIPADTMYPALADAEGWIRLRQRVNAMMDQYLAPVGAMLKSSCETHIIRGVTVHCATPPDGSGHAERAYLDVHGGALIYCEGEFCRVSARRNADILDVRVYGVDYRNPPEHPYPAALDDCVAVYRALLERYAPENLIVGGLSAGGNLAAATLLRVRDEGLPMPAAAILLSPEADLTESGDTFVTLDGLDAAPASPLMPINLLYAAGQDLAHPYLSPLFADFSKGFPPAFLQSGTRDKFLSNTVRLHRALRRSRIEAELHVFEAMPHGGFQGAPEDLELNAEVRRFADAHWGRPSPSARESI